MCIHRNCRWYKAKFFKIWFWIQNTPDIRKFSRQMRYYRGTMTTTIVKLTFSSLRRSDKCLLLQLLPLLEVSLLLFESLCLPDLSIVVVFVELATGSDERCPATFPSVKSFIQRCFAKCQQPTAKANTPMPTVAAVSLFPRSKNQWNDLTTCIWITTHMCCYLPLEQVTYICGFAPTYFTLSVLYSQMLRSK